MAYQEQGTCTCCGEKETTLTVVNDDDRVCLQCLDDLFCHCDVCGEYYSVDIEFTELDDGRLACEYCMEDIESEEDL